MLRFKTGVGFKVKKLNTRTQKIQFYVTKETQFYLLARKDVDLLPLWSAYTTARGGYLAGKVSLFTFTLRV